MSTTDSSIETHTNDSPFFAVCRCGYVDIDYIYLELLISMYSCWCLKFIICTYAFGI